ncbi:hypothetical protein GCM10010121_010540 [Streptomyces brasiliensis]|uniref:DUF202 domain-containing protein n=1 Tax=Streptomyces brasiliensis TaxID=1954 RepID=A0A917K7N4_9ACTN|nr:hypothetical protein GCM10010121_010540 [Streptomyces brasiliensis]
MVTVLALRVALHRGHSAAGIVVCALCCAFFAAFLWVAHHRIRTLATTPRPAALGPRQAAAAVLCASAMAVCAVALIAR